MNRTRVSKLQLSLFVAMIVGVSGCGAPTPTTVDKGPPPPPPTPVVVEEPAPPPVEKPKPDPLQTALNEVSGIVKRYSAVYASVKDEATADKAVRHRKNDRSPARANGRDQPAAAAARRREIRVGFAKRSRAAFHGPAQQSRHSAGSRGPRFGPEINCRPAELRHRGPLAAGQRARHTTVAGCRCTKPAGRGTVADRGGGARHCDQSSTRSPETRQNSLILLVTNVRSAPMACAASSKS